MFYVHDEPEGKFLNTGTIKLYCTLPFSKSHLDSRMQCVLHYGFYSSEDPVSLVYHKVLSGALDTQEVSLLTTFHYT